MQFMSTLHYSAFYICAILLCASCICYTLLQGRVIRQQNKVYIMLLANMLFCAVSMICVTFFERQYGAESHFIADMSRFVSYVFHDAMAPIFAYYVFLVCGNAWKLTRRTLVLYSLPFLFTEFVILMNPLTDWVYHYDSAFQYHRNWGAYSIYVAAFFYMMMGLQNLLRYWRALTSAKRNALVFFISLVSIGILIQVIWQDILIELYTDALAALGLMLSIEDEDARIHTMTGALNRYALQLDLNNYFAMKLPFQVIGVQITNLRMLHRTMGAASSDAFLRIVADYLRTLVPPYCIYYANLSTYIILLPQNDAEQAADIASHILDRFNRTWKNDKVETLLHAAIIRGMAPDNFSSSEDVLFMADNPIPAYSENKVLSGGDLSYLLRHLEVERAIHRGLEKHTFEVYYQPVYDLPSLRLRSAEALLRLHDRVLGNIPPAEFIPAAERAGLIANLGEFVLEKVCIFLTSGVPDELGLSHISVNLPILQCVQPDFADSVRSIVNRFGVEPSRINFEITETVATNDYNALDGVIRELKRDGFTFAMDDYGTGYSNMQAVFSLDFDTVKLDKSILWNAEKNLIGRAILENSVRMIRDMQRKISIEGVETEEQLQLAQKLSVDYLQGFYFSKPMPKDAFIELARSGQAPSGSSAEREASS